MPVTWPCPESAYSASYIHTTYLPQSILTLSSHLRTSVKKEASSLEIFGSKMLMHLISPHVLQVKSISISMWRVSYTFLTLAFFFRYGSSRTCRRGCFHILFALFLQQMQPVTRHFPCCVISGLFEVNGICHLLRISVVTCDPDYTTEVHNNYRKYAAILPIYPRETYPEA